MSFMGIPYFSEIRGAKNLFNLVNVVTERWIIMLGGVHLRVCCWETVGVLSGDRTSSLEAAAIGPAYLKTPTPCHFDPSIGIYLPHSGEQHPGSGRRISRLGECLINQVIVSQNALLVIYVLLCS